MKRWTAIAAALLMFVVPVSCGEEMPESVSASLSPGVWRESEVDFGAPYEVLRDRKFRNGLDVSGYDSTDTSKVVQGALTYGGSVSGNRYWRLDQWGSRFDVCKSEESIGSGWVYRDESKRFEVDPATGRTRMKLNASEEYVGSDGTHRARQSGENWPCMLLTEFTNPVPLKLLEHLFLDVDFLIERVENRMGESFDESLHSAQFQWYITPQVYDFETDEWGDMFWFGVPFFDARYETIPEYAATDTGKNDATNKFIYNMSSAEVFEDGSAKVGRRETISVDVLPYIRTALERGRQQNFLKGVTFDQLAISSTNIGWELPGTFDISTVIDSMSITAVWKS